MNFHALMYEWSFGGQDFSVDPLSTIPVGEDEGAVFWTVVPNMTEADAVQISNDHKWAEVRRQRDAKIAETDWWVLPDRTPTQAQLDYRQALRDITSTFSSPDVVVWPTKPA
jgi:hypothetical protein